MTRGQVERPAGEAQAVALGARRRQAARAAQDAFHARQQLARIEGLAEVVVGAHLDADDAVELLAARGEHDDRQVRARTQIAAQRQAVLARQHDVEHDDVEARLGQQLAHLAPVARHGNAKAVARQVFRQQVAQFGVVVDDQDVVLAFHAGAIYTPNGLQEKRPCNAL